MNIITLDELEENLNNLTIKPCNSEYGKKLLLNNQNFLIDILNLLIFGMDVNPNMMMMYLQNLKKIIILKD